MIFILFDIYFGIKQNNYNLWVKEYQEFETPLEAIKEAKCLAEAKYKEYVNHIEPKDEIEKMEIALEMSRSIVFFAMEYIFFDGNIVEKIKHDMDVKKRYV